MRSGYNKNTLCVASENLSLIRRSLAFANKHCILSRAPRKWALAFYMRARKYATLRAKRNRLNYSLQFTLHSLNYSTHTR